MTEFHRKVYIVRHGERLDEAEPGVWERHCERKHNKTEMYYRVNDPPLTRSGSEQAAQVAKSIRKEVLNSGVQFVFASKLLRAVQTAYPIAMQLQIPLIVSRNFALTAAAVEMRPDYRFLDITELQTLCPGVTVIDGDHEDSHESHRLPLADAWHHAIEHVVTTHQVSIIVAHRESIRNMAQMHLATPYCCYGEFRFPADEPPRYQHASLHRLLRPSGKRLDISNYHLKRHRLAEALSQPSYMEQLAAVVGDLFGAIEVVDEEEYEDDARGSTSKDLADDIVHERI
jgi:broad specificity phosphatase PhoE